MLQLARTISDEFARRRSPVRQEPRRHGRISLGQGARNRRHHCRVHPCHQPGARHPRAGNDAGEFRDPRRPLRRNGRGLARKRRELDRDQEWSPLPTYSRRRSSRRRSVCATKPPRSKRASPQLAEKRVHTRLWTAREKSPPCTRHVAELETHRRAGSPKRSDRPA